MKTLKLLPLFLMAFLCCNYAAVAQDDDDDENEQEEILKITGVYKGYEAGTYNFSYKEDGEDLEINFEKVAPEIAKALNLTSTVQVGKSFEVQYTSINEEETDNDGDIMYSNVKTIISLRPVY